MTEVVSFRPTPDEEALIRRTQRSLGSKTRSQAVRFLLQEAAKVAPAPKDDPLFRTRAAPEFWFTKPMTSRDIDRELYGRKT